MRTYFELVDTMMRTKASKSRYWQHEVGFADLTKLAQVGPISFKGWTIAEFDMFDRFLDLGGDMPKKAKAYLRSIRAEGAP